MWNNTAEYERERLNKFVWFLMHINLNLNQEFFFLMHLLEFLFEQLDVITTFQSIFSISPSLHLPLPNELSIHFNNDQLYITLLNNCVFAWDVHTHNVSKLKMTLIIIDKWWSSSMYAYYIFISFHMRIMQYLVPFFSFLLRYRLHSSSC